MKLPLIHNFNPQFYSHFLTISKHLSRNNFQGNCILTVQFLDFNEAKFIFIFCHVCFYRFFSFLFAFTTSKAIFVCFLTFCENHKIQDGGSKIAAA